MKTHSLLLLCLLLSIRVFPQTFIYVNGSAPSGGTGTFASPFNKISHAITAAANNSYTIINVRAGTYAEKLWIDKSGTPTGYLTIKPYQNETPILDGTTVAFSPTEPKEAVTIQSASYVRIEGLKIQNYVSDFAKGISVYCNNYNSRFIEIINNDISNVSVIQSDKSTNPLVVFGHSYVGAATYIDNVLISGNKIHDCNTGYAEGIQINYDTRNFEVKSNKVYNITNIGIVAGGYHEGINKRSINGKIWLNEVYNCKSPFAIAAGIYIDGAKNVTAERNIVYDCQKGMAINCEVLGKIAENDTIRNNFIYNNTRGAINIGGNNPSNSSGHVVNSAVLNNSTFQNYNPSILAPNETSPINFGEITLYYSLNCKVVNNIFHAGNYNILLNGQNVPPPAPSPSQNILLNNNVWFSNVSLVSDSYRYFGINANNLYNFQAQTSQDLNSVYGNPHYQSGSTGNLRIRCASAAINLASTTAYAGQADYFGETRKVGNKIEAGADEFERYKHQSSNTGNWLSTSTWQLNLVPLSCDDVLIKSGHKVNLLGTQNTSCKTILTEPNSVFDCPKTAIFSVNPNN